MDKSTTHPDAKALPQSRRGQNTRKGLLKAARVVFERDGFINAKISDITLAADVASGSFYTYFSDKRDVFMALVEQVEDEMLHLELHLDPDTDDPIEKIRATNRAYLVAYRDVAPLMKVLEQVATLDEEFRALRVRRGDSFNRRNAKSILRLQAEGLADRSLDAELAAMALSAMVGRVAYSVFALGSKGATMDDLVETLTVLWVNALRIERSRPDQ